jgi:hypothetical protein
MRFEHERNKISNGKYTTSGKVERLILDVRKAEVEESVKEKMFTSLLISMDFIEELVLFVMFLSLNDS